jgi:hypothetical protein
MGRAPSQPYEILSCAGGSRWRGFLVGASAVVSCKEGNPPPTIIVSLEV